MRSVADDKDTRPKHASPYSGTVDPGHPMHRNGVIEPNFKGSGADVRSSRHAGLRSDGGGPKCKKSGAGGNVPKRAGLLGAGDDPRWVRSVADNGNTKPKQAKPYGGAVSPSQAVHLGNMIKPSFRGSGTSVEASSRAELRGGIALPVKTESGTKTGLPMRPMPNAGGLDSAQPKLRNGVRGPGWRGSGTEADGSKRARLRRNRLASK